MIDPDGGDVVALMVAHPQPWTLDDLFTLNGEGTQHELLDGTVLVSPAQACCTSGSPDAYGRRWRRSSPGPGSL